VFSFSWGKKKGEEEESREEEILKGGFIVVVSAAQILAVRVTLRGSRGLSLHSYISTFSYWATQTNKL